VSPLDQGLVSTAKGYPYGKIDKPCVRPWKKLACRAKVKSVDSSRAKSVPTTPGTGEIAAEESAFGKDGG